FFHMAIHLHLAPLLAQHAVGVDEEGAALDAHDLSAVHVLLADDVEHAAHLAVLVGQEPEGKAFLLAELLVGFQAVARDAEDDGVAAAEAADAVAEGAALHGAAGGAVPGVKIEDDVAAPAVRETDVPAAGGGEFENGNLLP